MPKAYSYIRFSTPEQGKGDSLRRQRALAESYAKEHNLELDDSVTYRDLGVSAFKKANLAPGGKLRAFIDAVDQGLVAPGSFLLVESLDRLSRAKIMDAFRVFLDIMGKGITIVTLRDRMVYSEDTQDANAQGMSLIISLTVMMRAHEESATKSDRLKNAWSNKRKVATSKKMTAICPAWLTLDKATDSYVEVPEKVAIVHRIISMIESGVGKDAVAKRFNETGIPTIGLDRLRRKGGDGVQRVNPDRTWFSSYISKIIKNRALIGEFQPYKVLDGKRIPDGEPLEEYFPRIISPDRFVLLQDLISGRGKASGGRRGSSFSNLFTGLARCGYCGGTMVYVDKGIDKRGMKDPDKSKFLVCHKAKRGAGCHYVPWTYIEFESAFFRYAKNAGFETFIKNTNDTGEEIRTAHHELILEKAKKEEFKLKAGRLVEVITSGQAQPNSILDKIVEFERAIAISDEKITKIEDEIASLTTRQKAGSNSVQALRNLATELELVKGDERFLLRARLNEHLRRILERLLLFPGGPIATPNEVNNIRDELLKTSRYSPEAIESYISTSISTKPNKQERLFLIRNRNQVIRLLRPDVADPQIVEVLLDNPGLADEGMRIQRNAAIQNIATN